MVMSVNEKMTAIADAIRDKTGGTEALTLDGMASAVQKVFDKGFTDGKQAEYDAFWDTYQSNGSRRNHAYAFGGNGWNDTTFKPKRDIIVTSSADYMFANSAITNLKTALRGKKLDFSGLTGNAYAVFSGMTTNAHLPALDFGKCKEFRQVFYRNTALQEIESIRITTTCTTAVNAFQGCSALTTVIFTDDSVINCSGLNFKDSLSLNIESLRSILKILSSNGSGKSITFATVHQSIIESDSECIQYATAAGNAGWSIAYNS